MQKEDLRSKVSTFEAGFMYSTYLIWFIKGDALSDK